MKPTLPKIVLFAAALSLAAGSAIAATATKTPPNVFTPFRLPSGGSVYTAGIDGPAVYGSYTFPKVNNSPIHGYVLNGTNASTIDGPSKIFYTLIRDVGQSGSVVGTYAGPDPAYGADTNAPNLDYIPFYSSYNDAVFTTFIYPNAMPNSTKVGGLLSLSTTDDTVWGTYTLDASYDSNDSTPHETIHSYLWNTNGTFTAIDYPDPNANGTEIVAALPDGSMFVGNWTQPSSPRSGFILDGYGDFSFFDWRSSNGTPALDTSFVGFTGAANNGFAAGIYRELATNSTNVLSHAFVYYLNSTNVAADPATIDFPGSVGSVVTAVGDGIVYGRYFTKTNDAINPSDSPNGYAYSWSPSAGYQKILPGKAGAYVASASGKRFILLFESAYAGYIVGPARVPQTITFTGVTNSPVTGDFFNISAVSSAGLPVVFDAIPSNAPFSVVGSSTNGVNGQAGLYLQAARGGKFSLVARVAGDIYNLPAKQVYTVITKPGSQDLSGVSLPSVASVGSSIPLSYVSGANIPVTFSVLSGPAKITSSGPNKVLTFGSKPGTVVLLGVAKATPAYAAAKPVKFTITVQ